MSLHSPPHSAPRRLIWLLALAGFGLILVAGEALPDELNCPRLNLSTARPDTPERYQRGLLWRISKPDVSPSYLFGTIHLADHDVKGLPAPVASAFDQSRRFVMEALLDGADLGHWTLDTIAEDGGALRDQLGPALFGRASLLLSNYAIPPSVVDRMKAWTVYLTLSTPPDPAGLPLDLDLEMRAEQAGKPVSGLETVSEQIDSIAALPMEEQVALVKDAVCHYDILQEDIRQMKRLYLGRDLAGLVRAANRYELAETPRHQHLLQKLLFERNGRLFQRMQPYLQQGEAFIALGALHLPGEQGLLMRLEREGYTVEPIY